MRSRFLIALALACSLATGAASAGQDAASAPAPAVVESPASAPAPAAPAAAPPALQPAPAYSSGPAAGSLLQTIVALCFVLGLLGVLAWAMKRYGPKAQGGAANLRLVGALNLGGRERIMVVEVGDQWIVVGASPGRINALATMPKQEGIAVPVTQQTNLAAAGSFSEWLKQTVEKRNAK
jgi:flagellar protein FliO/FliZ